MTRSRGPVARLGPYSSTWWASVAILREAPVIPIPEGRAITREEINRVIVDINQRLDTIFDVLAALDTRLTALGG